MPPSRMPANMSMASAPETNTVDNGPLDDEDADKMQLDSLEERVTALEKIVFASQQQKPQQAAPPSPGGSNPMFGE